MTSIERNKEQPTQIANKWILLGIIVIKIYFMVTMYLFFLNTPLREADDIILFTPKEVTEELRLEEVKTNFWQRLAPLDGQLYIDISKEGYRVLSSSIQGDFGNYAFFPLLPSILYSIRTVTPEAVIPITIFLMLFMGTIGTFTLYKLSQRLNAPSLLTLGALICFPSAPFQYILYTESIFLCLSALTLLYTFEKRIGLVILFATLGGLCRPQGILLLVPIFIECIWPYIQQKKEVPYRNWVAVCVPACGFITMAFISKMTSDSWLSFLQVQTKWGRSFEITGFLKAFTKVFGYDGPPMDLIGLLVAVGCLPIIWKKLPRSLFFYSLVTILMPLSTGSILSIGRFISISIPHLLALGIFLENRSWGLRLGMLISFYVLQVILMRGMLG